MSFGHDAVIVTGAGSGIGRGIATQFAAEGATVVVNDVSAERADETLGLVVAAGGSGVVHPADVADEEQVQELVSATFERFGSCAALINNAGVLTRAPLLDLSAEDWDRVMRVNTRSVFLLTQAVARRWVAAGVGGKVVNIASVQAEMASTMGLAHYCSSKGAVRMFTRVAAAELAPHRINVNAIGPGTVATQIAGDRTPEELEAMLAASVTPLGRGGTPADIAHLAVFLCRPEAEYITGQFIMADGGRNLTAGPL